MAERYELISTTLGSNTSFFLIAITLTVITWGVFSGIRQVFDRYRQRTLLRPQLLIINIVESGVRCFVGVFGTFLVVVDVSFLLGWHTIVLETTPHFLVATITIIVTWLITRALTVIFNRLKIQGTFSDEAIRPIELFVKSSVIAVCSSLLILYLLSGIGYVYIPIIITSIVIVYIYLLLVRSSENP